jgi:hypothetical protein
MCIIGGSKFEFILERTCDYLTIFYVKGVKKIIGIIRLAKENFFIGFQDLVAEK